MTKQDIADLAEIIGRARSMVLTLPDGNTVGLGRDLQDVIVKALEAVVVDVDPNLQYPGKDPGFVFPEEDP